MNYGFVYPFGDPHSAAAWAHEAEASGWDGFFVWEAIWGMDPWVTLGAAAMTTARIRLGTMLTPIAIRRPWKLASETATLDRLSNGRVILSVGLGALDTGFDRFGEPADRKTRAELMDEGLQIITGLWRGQPFRFDGRHYHLQETSFQPPPPPVQQPRIPIWVVGAWPSEKSMQRVLQYDGLLPNKMGPNHQHLETTPEDIRAMAEYVRGRRSSSAPFEIVVEGQTPGERAAGAAQVGPWAEAGATWWIEAAWTEPDAEKVRTRLHQGPPRLE